MGNLVEVMWYAVGGGWKGSVLSEGQDKKHIRWLQVCKFCSTFAATFVVVRFVAAATRHWRNW